MQKDLAALHISLTFALAFRETRGHRSLKYIFRKQTESTYSRID